MGPKLERQEVTNIADLADNRAEYKDARADVARKLGLKRVAHALDGEAITLRQRARYYRELQEDPKKQTVAKDQYSSIGPLSDTPMSNNPIRTLRK